MIYLVSNDKELVGLSSYKTKTYEETIDTLSKFEELQIDSETTGRDAHINKLLCFQLGTPDGKDQYVIDTSTVDIMLFKDLLESKLLIGHNLKFDIKFLYQYEIIPMKIWDTMIIEQLLHLGYDNKFFHYSLKAVADRYLGIDIDKSIRGEIIWRGLDDEVIKYAAGDVTYLSEIKRLEELECKRTNCERAAKLENAFVPVISYLEWCGIKLDVEKWKAKLHSNEEKLEQLNTKLEDFVLKHGDYHYIDRTLFGDMCDINWNSEQQTIPFIKSLGFNVNVEDKKTGKYRESADAKNLRKQKGVNDEFLSIYLEYKETQKDLSTYGIQYINSINPNTGRIHTVFWQLGADTGRMSCGSNKPNTDLSRLNKVPEKTCIMPQLQNLPADEETRSCFVSEPDNLMVSCDYSALESRLGADIYNEPSMIEEFLERSGDIHSLVAHHCFKKELADIPIEKIKELRPDLRKRAKGVGFSQQFGGSAKAIQNSLGCTLAEAKEIANAYNEGFKGIAKFKEQGSNFVRTNGYIVLCKKTGHKTYWEDFSKWRKMEDEPENMWRVAYTNDQIKEHNMAASKWDRKALNSVTQGTGVIILKYAMVLFFRWIIENGYFNKVLLCDLVHDEAVVEFPKELVDVVPNKLKEFMEKSAGVFCKKLPIPAVPEVGDHWIH